MGTYIWITLLAASFLPDPVYPQYFCLLVPFLILDVVALLATVQHAGRWTLVSGGITFVILGALDGYRYLSSGMDVPGVMTADRVSRWSIRTVERVAQEVDSLRVPLGASWWPGYFVSARTPLAVELANDFGLLVAGRIGEQERHRFHLIDRRELARRIQDRQFPVVVEGNWAARREADLLPFAGYEVAASIESVKIWTAHPPR
jgi:hypothetical protein